MASVAWAAVAPLYARGLGLLARPLIARLEGNAGTVYEVEGARLLAHRPVWLTRRRETLPLVQPLWVGSQNFGLPLLAALVLAVPGWTWRRRGRALAIGLAVLTLTQVAHLLVTIEATQQSPVMTAEGPVQLARYSPARQPLFYGLYYFSELMGRGFFALLVFAGLVAFVGEPAAAAPAGRNQPCPCGSGRKFKRCHGR